jgi:uncharacterized phage protein (TIGR01671 family)
MRQIKFRAWDKKYKEMINDIHIAPEYDWLVLSDNDALAERDNRGRGDDDGYELMQFTGLLDKNGKEIYEGDIVEGIYRGVGIDGELSVETNMCGIVFYDYSGFSLEVIQNKSDKDRYGMVNYFHFIGDDGGIFENKSVIGNIYENPELLNQ